MLLTPEFALLATIIRAILRALGFIVPNDDVIPG